MINIEVRICLTAISVRAVDNEKSVQDNITRNSFDDMFAVRRVLAVRREGTTALRAELDSPKIWLPLNSIR